jgi:hypothetical protein
MLLATAVLAALLSASPAHATRPDTAEVWLVYREFGDAGAYTAEKVYALTFSGHVDVCVSEYRISPERPPTCEYLGTLSPEELDRIGAALRTSGVAAGGVYGEPSTLWPSTSLTLSHRAGPSSPFVHVHAFISSAAWRELAGEFRAVLTEINVILRRGVE